MIPENHYSHLISEKRLKTIQRVVNHRQLDLTVIIENIHDPHNVGAIFRTADAVGIDEVNLLYTKEKFPTLHPKVTASGAKWTNQKPYRNAVDLAKDLHQRGFKIYSTHLSQDAVSIHDIDWTLPSAVVLGNEHRGVSAELTRLADQNIRIPMFGMVESLNVSVATAVILFEACRQRIAAGKYPNMDLDSKWVEASTESWAKINQRGR